VILKFPKGGQKLISKKKSKLWTPASTRAAARISRRLAQLFQNSKLNDHIRFAGLDFPNEFELAAGAIEVVSWVFGVEVGVAEEVIREEAESEFVGDEFAGKGEVFALGGGEHAIHGIKETRGDSLEHGDAAFDGIEIDGVLRGGRYAGAHKVSEIVEGKAGHHGIQIDDSDPFLRTVANEDVGDFGVVVGDALGDEAALMKINEFAGDGFVIERETDLWGA